MAKTHSRPDESAEVANKEQARTTSLRFILAAPRVYGRSVKSWTYRDSAELYNVAGWSNGYFDVNSEGNVALRPDGNDDLEIDLKRVVDDLVRRGLSLPILLRFNDILRKRLEELSRAFQDKIQEYNYKNRYQLVMPIKVNQQRHVVQELLAYGRPYGLGLEAGSKPELLIAIALMDQRDGLIVCNGYKDTAYIETALLAQRLGRKPLIIVDRFLELDLVIRAANRLGLKPNIGVRAKLASKGSGRWAETGGDRSKFGLSASELVEAVQRLKQENMLDRLVCLHFHIGSQISAIRPVKDALSEAVRIFVDLYKMGAPLSYMDVGGGLAVDYDGSRTTFHASKNYSLEEYAADIVHALGSTLEEENIPHPTILSESGRALVAHHAVLVFNVLGKTQDPPTQDSPTQDPPTHTPDANESTIKAKHPLVEEIHEVSQTVTRKNYQEAYHDALQLKEDALSLYRHGILNLRERAQVEQLFWAAAHKIWKIVRELDYIPEDLSTLGRQICDTYFCNFSVFQSVPDAWAVKHLFPVMPIHRLNEQPMRHGILADLTCDSDGKIDQFIDVHDVKSTLELHDLEPEEPYVLGIFLVGAYQEILGDLHNLFGDVHAVHIARDEEGGYSVHHIEEGDTVKEVLSYVAYDQRTLVECLRKSIETAISQGRMSFEESAVLMKHFEAGLASYTYLETGELLNSWLSSIVPRPNLSVVPEAG